MSLSIRSKMLAASALTTCLLAAAPAMAQEVAASAPAAEPEAVSSGDIVVTATRQRQSISRVPVSISAYSQEQMDAQGVRKVDDVVRLTPGVSITRGGTSQSSISIRGITSAVGASTIGVYVDDTPIQNRNIGTSSSIAYPIVFDLERVEVLRGPQGTLFGAGSEGGTIRFIQPSPSFTKASGYARGEIANTENGDLSYEMGVAVGAPIVEDKIAFRASAYYRRDGGYIDKVVGTPQVVDATGAAGPSSINFVETGTYKSDVNYSNSYSARLAVAFKPTETLTITPAVNYQKVYVADANTGFWSTISDYKTGDFKTPKWVPTVDATHSALDAPDNEPQSDKFVMPSLKIEWENDFANFTSNTSYFRRNMNMLLDYTSIYEVSYASRKVPSAGDLAISEHWNQQRNFTQEFRFQSADTSSRLQWVAGAFYTHNKQYFHQYSSTNFLAYLPTMFTATANGAPFGTGTSAFVNWYGVAPLNGVGTYDAKLDTLDEQYAGFGEASFRFTEKLKLTAGVRVSRNKVSYDAVYDGPSANLNAPHGLACVPGTSGATCVPVTVGQYAVGTGPFTPAYINGGSKIAETAVTPRFSLSYQIDPRNLIYATASKGFRPGGAQTALPSNCNAELVSLGYVDGNGNAAGPQSYDSDSVWSYEVGSKNRFFGNLLSINASAFLIKWKNIQSSVAVNTCLQSFTDNLGSATSKGFDLQAQLNPMTGLTLGTAIGYNKATFDDDTIVNGRTLYTKHSAIVGSGAPWTVVVSGEYNRPIDDKELYLRGDWTYTSRRLRTGATDAGSIYYDSVLPPLASTRLLNARVGMRFDGLDVSLFANNLWNSAPHLTYGHTKGQPIWTDYSFRPRTIGLTAAYRY